MVQKSDQNVSPPSAYCDKRSKQWADLIYVIEDGSVVEFGDWDALSARPADRFRAMREAQEPGS
jgi:hypothetical protein